MTPTQIARLLPLPLKARQRLAEQPGPGRWYRANGRTDGYLFDSPADIKDDIRPPRLLGLGWAWAPCCALAWLRAATPEGGAWFGSGPGGVWAIYRADASTVAMSADPITCALAALEATYGK